MLPNDFNLIDFELAEELNLDLTDHDFSFKEKSFYQRQDELAEIYRLLENDTQRFICMAIFEMGQSKAFLMRVLNQKKHFINKNVAKIRMILASNPKIKTRLRNVTMSFDTLKNKKL